MNTLSDIRVGWSLVAPVPPPLDVDVVVNRTISQDRRLLSELTSSREWHSLSWPELGSALMSLGRTDIALARLAEGHIDAMRIIHQADAAPVAGSLYGVWASRSRGGGLRVEREMDRFVLSGSLPFASGVGLLDRALVTATVEPPFGSPAGCVQQQLLLDVDVHDWVPDQGSWRTSAMSASRSFTVAVRNRSVPAYRQLGAADFYLQRRGFFPGGVGVAAVWVGAAARVADLLVDYLSGAGDLGPLQRGHLGRVRLELTTGGAILEQGIRRLADGESGDRSPHSVSELQDLSTEVRAGAGASVRRLLNIARELAGPAGLAHHPGLADAIADLDLYVRQQHADRDADHLAGRWSTT